MMRTGLYVAQQAGVFTHPGIEPGGMIPSEIFQKCGLPIVVECNGCRMSMSLLSPSCLVDANDRTWCPECAGLYEDEPTQVIPKDKLATLVEASDGRPDYFGNEVEPITRVRTRFRLGRDMYEVTPEEEYDILRDMLEIALLDRTVSNEAKAYIRDVLHITFSAPQHQAWDQALSEIWGIMEGSLADPEEVVR